MSPGRRSRVLRLAGRNAVGCCQTFETQHKGQQHMQATGLEVARLRTAAKSAAAERDSLRLNLAAAAVQSKQLDRELQALRYTSTTREQRAQERHAVQLAGLEEPQRSHRRAVLDLAAAAELLARENASCTTAWRSCKWAQQPRLMDENEDGSRAQNAERLSRLQAVCLQLEGQQAQQGPSRCEGTGCSGANAARRGGTCAPVGGQADVLEALSCTLRALRPTNAADATPGAAKPPPALAPVKVKAAARGLPTDLRLALRELDALAARLGSAEAQVLKLQEERFELQQSLVQERHAAAASAADLQHQFREAQARVEGMARRCKEKDAALAERDASAAKLERRLLQRGQPPAAAAARPGGAGARPPGQGPMRATGQREQPDGMLLAGRNKAVGKQAAAGPTAHSPGSDSLAALSPDPCPSAWMPWHRHDSSQQERTEQQPLQQAWARNVPAQQRAPWEEEAQMHLPWLRAAEGAAASCLADGVSGAEVAPTLASLGGDDGLTRLGARRRSCRRGACIGARQRHLRALPRSRLSRLSRTLQPARSVRRVRSRPAARLNVTVTMLKH